MKDIEKITDFEEIKTYVADLENKLRKMGVDPNYIYKQLGLDQELTLKPQ